MATAPLLSAHNLSRSYAGETPVLRGVSLAVQAGEMVALLGSSGSGKSTLLSILGALDTEYQGRVTLCGIELQALSDRQRADLRNRSLGFVFQAYNLLSHLDALHNVALPAVFSSEPTAVDLDRAATLLGRVGLAGLAGRHPSELSGGERQRVAIARSLYHDPQILLCDEPTGNLDRRTGGRIVDLLSALRQEGRGRAIVVATHDAAVAARADRVVALCDGRLVGHSADTADFTGDSAGLPPSPNRQKEARQP